MIKDYPRIFISHSSKDKLIAKKVLNWLIDGGFSVWFDTFELRPGMNLLQEISRGIYSSDYIILLVTKSSIQSEWVRFEIESSLKDEMDQAKFKLIPLVIEPIELPSSIKDKMYLKLVTVDSYKFDSILPSLFYDHFDHIGNARHF